MRQLTEKIRILFEFPAFGICDRLGEFLRIPGTHIRMFFIYASFLTFGSPLILYLILAFLINLPKMINGNRGSAWDL